jgi:predicted DNA-binding transcriptional regulator AlpA
MPFDLDNLLTEAELSKLLGISRPTLVRHRRFGTGPTFVRLSARRIGYRRSAVDAWLNEQAHPTTAKLQAGSTECGGADGAVRP